MTMPSDSTGEEGGQFHRNQQQEAEGAVRRLLPRWRVPALGLRCPEEARGSLGLPVPSRCHPAASQVTERHVTADKCGEIDPREAGAGEKGLAGSTSSCLFKEKNTTTPRVPAVTQGVSPIAFSALIGM